MLLYRVHKCAMDVLIARKENIQNVAIIIKTILCVVFTARQCITPLTLRHYES